MFVIDESLGVQIDVKRVFEVAVGFERVLEGQLEKWGKELQDGWRLDLARYINANGKKVLLKTRLALRIANYSTGDVEVYKPTYPEVSLLVRKMLSFLEEEDFAARSGSLILLKRGKDFMVSYGSSFTVLGTEERFLVHRAITHGYYFKGFGFWINDEGVSFSGYKLRTGNLLPLKLFLEVGLWKVK